MTATTEVGQRDRATIYVRESLDKYGDERAVERFEQECRRLCAQRGLRVVRALRDNDVRASKGNKGAGYAEVLRMMRARETDYVVVPVIDRFVRTLRDLEDVIDAAEAGGITVLATSGDIDLSHDQGRLVGRILASVAKGEMERKGARQRAAWEQSARAGRPFSGGQRPFGWNDGRKTLRPDEADAIRWAADTLLGGGTVSGVVQEWNRRGVRPPQAPFGPLLERPWTRQAVTVIMRNPRLAGLSVYRGEIVEEGNWEPVLTEAQWRAVESLLSDPSRVPPRGKYSLLGGLAVCVCGAQVQGSVNATRKHVYRCNPQKRAGRPAPHCQQLISNVDPYVEALIVARLSRDDVVELIASTSAAVDTVPLRREAASIRTNLEEMAADRALGLVTRAQMLKATERGTKRLEEIASALAMAGSESALAPFAGNQPAADVWESLDRSRKRAVIDALGKVVIYPAGRGSRIFDRTKVQIEWKQQRADF